MLGAPLHRAAAEKWPARRVTLFVPFPASAAIGTLASATAAYLSDSLGKQFIVENHTEAGGNIGGASVAKVNPDGYTALFVRRRR